MPSTDTSGNTALLDDSMWYLPLPDIAITLASGPDAERFLQGQLSCNVQKLDTHHSLRGALCNLKGRVLTDVQLVRWQHDIAILTWHGMQSTLLSTLNKYRVFFKTTLQAADPGIRVVGCGGTDISALAALLGVELPATADQVVHTEAATVIRLPSPVAGPARFLLLVDTRITSAHPVQQIESMLPRLPSASWALADIRDGIVHITPEQSERFTPQLLNYDINGIIDFKKGCYTGQEIVARMHYRAEAKRRLFYVQAEDETLFAARMDGIPPEDIASLQQRNDGGVESLVVLNVADALRLAAVSLTTDSAPIHG